MTVQLPAGVLAKNFDFVGYSDQGGMAGGTQVMVHRGHAYIGKNEGVSVLDVRDPRDPRAVNFLDGDVNSWHIHLQTHDDLLLVIDSVDFYMVKPDERDYYGSSISGVHSSRFGTRGKDFAAGMRVYDLSNLCRAEEDRLPGRRGMRPAPYLVRRRTLRLRVRPHRRLHRPHPAHHRPG